MLVSEILSICQDLKQNKLLFREMVIKYNVTMATINEINNGGRYKHMTGKNYTFPIRNKKKPLPTSKVIKVCKLLEIGVDPYNVCNSITISVNDVFSILRGKSYLHISENNGYPFMDSAKYIPREEFGKIRAIKIVELLKAGVDMRDIEYEAGCSRQFLYHVRKRKIYPEASEGISDEILNPIEYTKRLNKYKGRK